MSIDAIGQLIGKDDLALRTDQVMKNLERGLLEVSATFDDLVKTTRIVSPSE